MFEPFHNYSHNFHGLVIIANKCTSNIQILKIHLTVRKKKLIYNSIELWLCKIQFVLIKLTIKITPFEY